MCILSVCLYLSGFVYVSVPVFFQPACASLSESLPFQAYIRNVYKTYVPINTCSPNINTAQGYVPAEKNKGLITTKNSKH